MPGARREPKARPKRPSPAVLCAVGVVAAAAGATMAGDGAGARADRAKVGPPRVAVSLRTPAPATVPGLRYVVTARVRAARRGAAGTPIVADVRERRADGTSAGRWAATVRVRLRPRVIRVVTGPAEGGGRLRVRLRAAEQGRGVVAFALVRVEVADRRRPVSAPPPPAAPAPPPPAAPAAPPPAAPAPPPPAPAAPPPARLRVGPPAAGGYFRLLPVGAALPSEAECVARLSRSSWEPRPENGDANRRTPRSLSLPDHPDFDSRWNMLSKPRITGAFVGTTDEIIQWAACKWGLDDELIRAQAAAESDWRQAAEGDLERRAEGHCTPGDRRDPCPTSFGILQNKWYYNAGAYPMLRTMTAFHLDFSAAKLRGCYDGRRYHPAGDLWGCYAQWWSGRFDSEAGDAYVERVRTELSARRWSAWPDRSGGGA